MAGFHINVLALLLMALAFLCFIGDAFAMWQNNPRRPALTPLGLALWVIAVLIRLYH